MTNQMGGSASDNVLNTGWQIERLQGDYKAPMNVPGDVHSALLAEGLITDPYWRDTETSLDWVHESEWIARTQFTFGGDISQRHTLTLTSIDCMAIVYLNDHEIGRCDNQFIRWDFDVSAALIAGDNVLKIHFLSNTKLAAEMAASSDISVPYQIGNNRIPHYNFLRKTQCHAGWDWNIALCPIGIYGDVIVRQTAKIRFDDVLVRQRHESGHENENATVEVDLNFYAYEAGQADLKIDLCSQTLKQKAAYYPGENTVTLTVDIKDPELWWPVGFGAQTLHILTAQVGDQTLTRKIGLRSVELDHSADEIGNRFAFKINGTEMFMRGANWIPADALPERCTPDVVRDRLQSALDANMNMIRVWGGGQYEPDWFYDLCAEMGILVWQDFMFACNLYPSHDKDWLKKIRIEARQQIRRLSSHACVALWCGDNELVGALGWYEETRNDRDRYLAMYDRLNHTLELELDDANIDVPFWPSSPSVGRLNFSDGWHDDTSGDMHFWDVWHSSKDFEHYRTVRPRFCSEFGFQSFPSMKMIESFTEPQDRNVSSAVMDVHQRNDGGNSRIVETISRYFRFPDRFDDMVYLSQISQAVAMKTSIEFWRSCKPRTMGTLYWQLNDTWPVASWASLEYDGNWKLTHYLARRFFDPVLVTAQPDDKTGEIVLWAVCDLPDGVALDIALTKVDVSGAMEKTASWKVMCDPSQAVEVGRVNAADYGDSAFLYFTWRDESGNHTGENEYLPLRPKAYGFQKPNITVQKNDNGSITLTSDVPVMYVTCDHGGGAVYSDNGFTLLPNMPKTINIVRPRGAPALNGEPKIDYLKSGA